MGWELTIDGDAVVLRWLVHSTAPVSPRVVAIGTAHRLEWDGLGAITLEHHEQVEAAALQHLVSLAGLASVLMCRHSGLRLTEVDFRRPDGGRNAFNAMHDSVGVSDTVEPESTVLGPDGQHKRVREENPVPRLLELVATDATVAKVLRLSSGDLKDWADLYRLYELLEDAAGGTDALSALAAVSKSRLSLFTRSANSPDLTGDASRHGVQRGSTPAKAMSLPDATQLLRHLSRSWLVARALR